MLNIRDKSVSVRDDRNYAAGTCEEFLVGLYPECWNVLSRLERTHNTRQIKAEIG